MSTIFEFERPIIVNSKISEEIQETLQSRRQQSESVTGIGERITTVRGLLSQKVFSDSIAVHKNIPWPL